MAFQLADGGGALLFGLLIGAAGYQAMYYAAMLAPVATLLMLARHWRPRIMPHSTAEAERRARPRDHPHRGPAAAVAGRRLRALLFLPGYATATLLLPATRYSAVERLLAAPAFALAALALLTLWTSALHVVLSPSIALVVLLGSVALSIWSAWPGAVRPSLRSAARGLALSLRRDHSRPEPSPGRSALANDTALTTNDTPSATTVPTPEPLAQSTAPMRERATVGAGSTPARGPRLPPGSGDRSINLHPAVPPIAPRVRLRAKRQSPLIALPDGGGRRGGLPAPVRTSGRSAPSGAPATCCPHSEPTPTTTC